MTKTIIQDSDGWTQSSQLKKGDVITLPGRYKRRTLREWLTREPRELQRFALIDDVTAGGMTRYEKTS